MPGSSGLCRSRCDIYRGEPFRGKGACDNLNEERMLEAIDYVHLHGRRLYMTVNTLFKEDELEELENYMRPYCDRGLDGVIVQDLGALAFMRRHFRGWSFIPAPR